MNTADETEAFFALSDREQIKSGSKLWRFFFVFSFVSIKGLTSQTTFPCLICTSCCLLWAGRQKSYLLAVGTICFSTLLCNLCRATVPLYYHCTYYCFDMLSVSRTSFKLLSSLPGLYNKQNNFQCFSHGFPHDFPFSDLLCPVPSHSVRPCTTYAWREKNSTSDTQMGPLRLKGLYLLRFVTK